MPGEILEIVPTEPQATLVFTREDLVLLYEARALLHVYQGRPSPARIDVVRRLNRLLDRLLTEQWVRP